MEFDKLVNHPNSIKSRFTRDELYEKTIVRDEVSNKYYVFDSKKEFETWYINKANKNYHEVIFGDQIQRLKFDIDSDVDIDIKIILKSIKCVIRQLYDISITKQDIIVTTSSGNTDKGYKYSYHIILFTFALANNIEAKFVTDHVITQLPDEYKKCIDKTVNKSIQNFRILFSSKHNSDRTKIVCNKYRTCTDLTLLDTLIVPFKGIKVLDRLCDLTENLEITEINNETVQKILNLLESYHILDGHTFRDVKENSINFNRQIPTHCVICNEVHHRDNSLVIQYNESTGNIYEYCRQACTKRFICNFKKNEDYFERIIQKNIYHSETMQEYEIVPTLFVRAQMKVGKTKMLHSYISNNYNSESLIRFISFRQTFGNHIHNLFNDFELYNNIKGSIVDSHKKVIIQTESLHRLEVGSVIDLLVLDEVESIFTQLSSGLHKNFNSSIAVFIWMLKTAKRVICIDANLSNRTYNLITKFRKTELFYHCNTWQSSKDDTFYITDDKSVWINNLIKMLQDNKKIVIATSSIMEAKTCELLIRDNFPNIIVKMYSSEMKHSEKQLCFNNVHKYWSELDVLIYTPTCSAGVSYELERFDVLFGYFYNTSCDVETCRQMMNRVRNIKTKSYYVFIQEIKNASLPSTVEDIHQYLYNKRLNLHNYVKDHNLQWSYDNEGNIKFYETEYYHIWLENMVITNLSKNEFVNRFYSQIHETGACIKAMVDVDSTVTIQDHNSLRTIVENNINEKIAESDDIEQIEAMTILNKISQNLDIEPEEFTAYEKYKLRKIYDYNGLITPTFVKYYKPFFIQKIYKHLVDISYCDTIEQSLERIVKRESERYSTITGSSLYKTNMEQNDLHNDNMLYTSTCHVVISKFIKILGIRPIQVDYFDKIFVEIIEPDIIENESQISIQLNTPHNGDKRKVLNNWLKNMYGIRLYKNKNTLCLKKCDGMAGIFTFNRIKIENTITIITNNELFLGLL
jgi:hypothetical protein